jgi:hypothetical protein
MDCPAFVLEVSILSNMKIKKKSHDHWKPQDTD